MQPISLLQYANLLKGKKSDRFKLEKRRKLELVINKICKKTATVAAR